ncbi:MAG TPA: sigma 54-interacting transcriptional regulator [Planctomycetota bacterium]|nr:sigma 54-interacting transcriptional regulator [Planctomycetota bacterium]
MGKEISILGADATVSGHEGDHVLDDILAEETGAAPADVPAWVLEGILRLTGARAAVLVRKESSRRRQMCGLRRDGTVIGRPDKVLVPEHVRKTLLSPEAAWVSCAKGDATLWSGLAIPLRGRTRAALFVEDGDGAVDPERALTRDSSHAAAPDQKRLDAVGLASLLGAVLTTVEVRAENQFLREQLIALAERRDPLSPAGCAPAARALLEYPLAGTPAEASAAFLFASFPEIVGQSPALKAVLHAVLTAARSDIPVLIEGESGTGKELVARAIHKISRRGGEPFVSENCGALAETLVESEFFGHERGAFTGADQRKAGLFERAHTGTVFLDEVGEMDLGLQRKLLRVLQEKEVRRLGGQETVPVDFRLLSATNRVLEDMVSAGKFREDLYYRLNVLTIHMPALRERPGDIPLLVEHFNALIASETGGDPVEFTEDALAVLLAYSWPGNIRELRNEIWSQHGSDRRRIDAAHLSRRILRAMVQRPPSEPTTPSARLLQDLEVSTMGGAIRAALERSKGNRAEAARSLGISRSSLYRRMLRYRLIPAPPRADASTTVKPRKRAGKTRGAARRSSASAASRPPPAPPS